MKLWQEFLENLEQEIGSETVRLWLKPLKVLRYDAANLYLEVENQFQIDWFEEHIRPRIEGKLYNNNHRLIKVHLSLPFSSKGSIAESSSFFITPLPLDIGMTLETWISSEQNQLAVDVIHGLLTEPSKVFNPLFFHGPKNAGKTHLLHAAALLLTQKGLRCFYTTANQFTEHVVIAIKMQKMREFRKVYREVDVLIVDDLQALKTRAATQEEFFHTFNSLHTAGKHILLSAHCSPSQLEGIEPRLISRFEWGLSLGLTPAPAQSLLEKKKASHIEWLLSLPDPMAAYHLLEVRSQGKKVSLEKAKYLLQDLIKESLVTPEQILKKVAAHYGVKTEDLLGKSREKEFALPRKVAMYLFREKLGLTLQKIGEIFQKDHSTVMASIEFVKALPQLPLFRT